MAYFVKHISAAASHVLVRCELLTYHAIIIIGQRNTWTRNALYLNVSSTPHGSLLKGDSPVNGVVYAVLLGHEQTELYWYP